MTSPALLSKRLKSLTRAGVVERSEIDGRTTHSLTPCGEELTAVVDRAGRLGVRWIGELGEADLDPHLLMWDMRRSVPLAEWPDGRTTLTFRLDGGEARASRWWLVVADGRVDVCDSTPATR
ncbi:MAG: winged helix-turn-helix transcriptional regulator [Actinomycetota bacterium]|nr:winged helix-turn-helix transcriptional regulator [Actinomycetota bacterium]